jgi:hypothetical protein
MLLLAMLALAGCDSSRSTVAGCLNAQGFLVQEKANVTRGSSPRGVNFTLTIYRDRSTARRAFAVTGPARAVMIGDAVVDFAGNPPTSPGGTPGTLSRTALRAIRLCLSRS